MAKVGEALLGVGAKQSDGAMVPTVVYCCYWEPKAAVTSVQASDVALQRRERGAISNWLEGVKGV